MKRYTTQNPTKYFIFITISSGVLPQHHQSLSKCVMLQWANDSRHCPLWWRPFLASRKGQTRVPYSRGLKSDRQGVHQGKSTNAFILQRLKILLVFHQSSRIFFFLTPHYLSCHIFSPSCSSPTLLYVQVRNSLLKAYST